MNRYSTAFIIALAVGLQACGGGTNPTPSTSSSSSSSSSSTSTSSGSSSSGAALFDPQVMQDGHELIDQVRAATRLKKNSTPLDYFNSMLSGDTQIAFADFAGQLNDTQLLQGKSSEYFLEAFALSGMAVMDSLSRYIIKGQENVVATSRWGWPGTPAELNQRINVERTSTDVGAMVKHHRYVIQQMVNLCDNNFSTDKAACEIHIDLIVEMDFARRPTIAGSLLGQTIGITHPMSINFSGRISNGYNQVELIPNGSGNHIDLSELYVRYEFTAHTGWSRALRSSITASGLNLNVPIQLSQLNASEPITTDMNIYGGVGEAGFDVMQKFKTETIVDGSKNVSEFSVAVYSLTDLNLNMDGIIRNSFGESLQSHVQLSKTGTTTSPADAPFTYILTNTQTCSMFSGRCANTITSQSLNESANHFLDLSLKADFDAILAGVAPASYTLEAERTSDQLTAIHHLDITSAENSAAVSGFIDRNGVFKRLHAINENRLNFQIFSDQNGKRSGVLFDAEGRRIAEAVEVNGVLTLTFIDGIIETF